MRSNQKITRAIQQILNKVNQTPNFEAILSQITFGSAKVYIFRNEIYLSSIDIKRTEKDSVSYDVWKVEDSISTEDLSKVYEVIGVNVASEISSVLIFPNGNVAVFDHEGKPIPEYQKKVWEEGYKDIYEAVDHRTIISDYRRANNEEVLSAEQEVERLKKILHAIDVNAEGLRCNCGNEMGEPRYNYCVKCLIQRNVQRANLGVPQKSIIRHLFLTDVIGVNKVAEMLGVSVLEAREAASQWLRE